MSVFDTRALTAGFAGASVLALLEAAQRKANRAHKGRAMLSGTAAYTLVGASSRPLLSGAAIGIVAGLATVVAEGRRGLGALLTVGSHAAAGVAAGLVYDALTTDEWPARDWDEVFFP